MSSKCYKFLKFFIIIFTISVVIISISNVFNAENINDYDNSYNDINNNYQSNGFEDNPFNNVDNLDVPILNYKANDYLDFATYEPLKNNGLLKSNGNSEPWKVEQFDSRSVNGKSYVTSVKNQNPFGTCWAFATTAAAESSYLKSHPYKQISDIDLSEYHLADYAYNSSGYPDPLNLVTNDGVDLLNLTKSLRVTSFTTIFNLGGSLNLGAATFASGIGLVKENPKQPYDYYRDCLNNLDFNGLQKFAIDGEFWLDSSYCYNRDYILKNVNMLKFNINNIDIVKKEIYEKGAVGASMYFDGDAVKGTPGSCYNSTYKSYFWNRSLSTDSYVKANGAGPNHAITLVGWDDNFSKTKFNNSSSIPNNGAWLVKNSWGKSWGDNGYFWISYYDEVIVTEPAFSIDIDEIGDTKIYQYESSQVVSAVFGVYGESIMGGRVIYPQANESVNDVMIYLNNNNVDCQAEIYTDIDIDILSSKDNLRNFLVNNNPKTTASSFFAYPGYHAVHFDKPAYVEEGSPYLVVIKIKTQSDDFPYMSLVKEYPNANYYQAYVSGSLNNYSINIRNKSDGLWFFGDFFSSYTQKKDQYPNDFDDYYKIGKLDYQQFNYDLPIKAYTSNADYKGAYTVNYYFQNEKRDGYVLDDTKTTTTLTDVGKTIKSSEVASDLQFNGFVFDSSKDESIVIEYGEYKVINVYFNRAQYSINFNTDGGNTINSIKYYYGDKITKPTNPTKTGYTFDKWEPEIPDKMPNKTLNVIALWNVNKYNISYQLNGGSLSDKPSSIDYDSEFTIVNPTKTGYTFTGWKIENMDGTTHIIGGVSKTDTTLNGVKATKFKNLTSVNNATVAFTANWQANSYKITYDLDGGTLANYPESANYDQEIEILNPKKTGFSFSGWTISGMDQTTHWIGTESKKDDTLYNVKATKFKNLTSANNAVIKFVANWGAQKVKVVVNHNVQSTDETTYETKDTDTITDTYSSNQKVKFIDLSKSNTQYPYFTYTGGVVGTTTSTTLPSSFGTEFNVSADGSSVVNLFYTRNKYELKIEYDAGIKEVSVNNSIYSNTLNLFYNLPLSLKATTNTGYSFNKWTLNTADIVGANADTLSTNMPSSNSIYKAFSTANTYNISYILNGGSLGTNKPEKGTYNTELKIDNPTRTGYTFTGWTIENMDETTHIIGGASITGTTLNDVKATKFKNLTSVNNATVAFTANWQANSYKITYDLDGGTLDNRPESANYDQEIEILNPTKTGYTFTGWKIENMDGTTHIIGGASKTGTTLNDVKATKFKNLTSVNNATVAFTANWLINEYNYTIKVFLMNTEGTYNTNSPYKTINGTASYNTDIIYSKDEDKDAKYNHFTLDEDQSDLTTKIDEDNKVINIFYIRNKYSITITDSNNAALAIIGSGKYFYEQIVHISASIKPGYKFKKWGIDSLEFNAKEFDYTVKEMSNEIVLYTEPIKYNLLYIIGDDATIDNDSLIHEANYDQEFEVPIPSKNGHVFSGWEIEGLDETTHIINGQQVTSDHIDSTYINGICKNLTTKENATIKFTALWTEGTSINYNVCYYYQDIEGNYSETPDKIDTQTCVQNSPFDLSVPKIDGFTFDDENSDSIKNIKFEINDINVIVKYKRNKYYIYLSTDPGIKSITSVADDRYYGSEVVLTAVANDGYSFDKWEKDGKFYSNSNSIKIKVDIENNYKATTKANTYTIDYVLNGGFIHDDAPRNVSYGEAFTVPHPVKSGFEFKGWHIKNMSRDLHYLNGEELAITEYKKDPPIKGFTSTVFKNLNTNNNRIVQLIAIWAESDDTNYTIEHYLMNDDGSYNKKPYKTESKNGKTGDTVTAQPISVTGYEYSQSNENSGTIIADGTLCIKLYYDKIKYTIKFNGNGATSGSNPDIYAYYNTYVEMPSNKFKNINASFIGWQIESESDNIKCVGDNQFKINESFINKYNIDKIITIKAIWRDETVNEEVPGNITYGEVKNLTNINSNKFKSNIKNNNIKDLLYSDSSNSHSAVAWLKTNDCSDSDISQMSSALKSKNISYKSIYYLDINLYKAEQSQPEKAVKLSELSNSAKLSLDINEYPDLLSSINTNKIVIYSIHDGELQNPINIDYDKTNKQILFNTSKFSVYALCVLNEPTDIKSDTTGKETKTDDKTNTNSDSTKTDTNNSNNINNDTNKNSENSQYKIPPTGIY